MKKKYLFLILLFASTTVFAQSPWWIGARGGVSFVTMSGTYDTDNDQNTSFIGTPFFGLTGIYAFSPLLAIQAELNLAKTGSLNKYNINLGEVDNYEYTYRERYSNIQFPVLARLTFGDKWQFFVYGGFYWSYKLCGKYVIKGNGDEQSGKIKFGDENDFDGDDIILARDENRRHDFGTNVGGGVQRQVGPGMLGIDFRFGLGFLDTNRFPDGDRPENYKPFKNRALGLTLFYNFNLKE